MPFALRFTNHADNDLTYIEDNPGLAKRLKSIRKALGNLQTNPRYPGLNTHKYASLVGPSGEDAFEAYAEI